MARGRTSRNLVLHEVHDLGACHLDYKVFNSGRKMHTVYCSVTATDTEETCDFAKNCMSLDAAELIIAADLGFWRMLLQNKSPSRRQS